MTSPEQDAMVTAARIAVMVSDGLTRGVAGDWNGAVDTMRPLFTEFGPVEAYAWLAAMIRHIPVHDCGCGEPVRPVVSQLDTFSGQVILRDINDEDVPRGVRMLSQMIAALGNGDDDTAQALWAAVVNSEDSDATVDIMRGALLWAIRAVRERAGTVGRPGEPDD
jgi:hypothetical protein